MVKYFLLLLLTTVFSLAKSQEIPWGKVSPEEWAITEVPFENGAAAVKLKEIGMLKITNKGYELLEFGRTKILSDNGFEKAQRKWSYRPTLENDKVVLIDAQTINLVNGKVEITPLDKKDIFLNNDGTVEVLAYAFRNVRVGSIIEYQIKINRPNNKYASPWNFQNDIPTISSKLYLDLEAYSDYKIILKGELLNKKYAGKKRNRTWELENIPSDKMYKNVYNVEDYREKLMYQYTSARGYYGGYYSENSWSGFKNLVNDDLKESKKYANFQEISDHIKDGSTKLETLKNCLQYLRDHYQWDRYTAVQTFDLASEFLRKKRGNSAEFNVVLKEILKLKNINSELAINSLRSNGRIIVAYPAFSKLQTLVNIVEVDQGEKILIDAATTTPDKVRFSSLDFYNQIVLGLDTKGDGFMMTSPTLSEYISQQYLTMNEENSVVTIKNSSRGYFNFEGFKDQTFDVFAGNKISENNEDEIDEWKISKQTLDFDNPSNNLLVIENPFTKIFRELSVEKNRNYPIELEFPFLATVQLKTKLSRNQKIISENFSQKISAFNGDLQYVQQIENMDGEEIITWSFLQKKNIFQNKEIQEYNQFMDQLQLIISKAAVIQNK